ncbi:hypothetical protein JB92DRAFT_2866867 [Gautieria morchelliformis]|nr:hypothetical protein JB92DRAFT_2866867 [Gautieria morchelliformis]
MFGFTVLPMKPMGLSGVMLPGQGPTLPLGSQIPLDIYHEIFAWLEPDAYPDHTDAAVYHQTLTKLALVCKYFAYYATREIWRGLLIHGNNYETGMPRMPLYNGILTQLEALQADVKECKITLGSCDVLSWIMPILPSLGNLRILTLDTIVPQSFLQTIGRLPALEQLIITKASVVDVPPAHSKEPLFGPHETSFPVLRQLTIESVSQHAGNTLFQDTLYALCGATTLRSVIIYDSYWLHRLLPHITPQLVSFCGDFSDITPDSFHRFVQGHTALQDLTLFFSENTQASSYLSVDLDPNDLPHLRSFSGPFILYPKIIRACPVTRLAFGCHLDVDFRYKNYDDPTSLSPSMLGLAVFPRACRRLERRRHIIRVEDMDHETFEDWTSLKSVGSSVYELFVRVKWGEVISGPTLGLCFPNVVRLELHIPKIRHILETLFAILAKLLGQFKSLKSFMLQSPDVYFSSTWVSPGAQHDFVHHVYQNFCPTLETVVIGPMMVWHLRDRPVHGPKCHCDLELLSPRLIRQHIGHLTNNPPPKRKARDWKGTLARVLREEPPISGMNMNNPDKVLEPPADGRRWYH